jgi:hypothetical protein
MVGLAGSKPAERLRCSQLSGPYAGLVHEDHSGPFFVD